MAALKVYKYHIDKEEKQLITHLLDLAALIVTS